MNCAGCQKPNAQPRYHVLLKLDPFGWQRATTPYATACDDCAGILALVSGVTDKDDIARLAWQLRRHVCEVRGLPFNEPLPATAAEKEALQAEAVLKIRGLM